MLRRPSPHSPNPRASRQRMRLGREPVFPPIPNPDRGDVPPFRANTDQGRVRASYRHGDPGDGSGALDADASPSPSAVSEQRRCRSVFSLMPLPHRRGAGTGGLCCALPRRQGTQVDLEVRPLTTSRPTPNLLVSQPDDLGFGVALSSAGEEDGVPRGDVCVLGFGCDPGPFCTNKEMETFLVFNHQGSQDPNGTPYVTNKSQVFKLHSTTSFPTKWQTGSSTGSRLTGQSPHSVFSHSDVGRPDTEVSQTSIGNGLSVRSRQGSETPVWTAHSMNNGFQLIRE